MNTSSSLRVMPVVAMLLSGAPTWADDKKPARLKSPLEEASYRATEQPAIVEIGPATYLTATGKGAPGSDAFKTKVGLLYGAAYGLKMRSSAAGKDFLPGTLEGIWWGSKDRLDFFDEPRETWNWKVLMRVPEFISADLVKQVAQQMGVGGDELKLETLKEGKCVQALHLGPYTDEARTIEAMKAFAKEKGLKQTGLHHEIYLNAPGQVPDAELRTIIRLPLGPA